MYYTFMSKCERRVKERFKTSKTQRTKMSRMKVLQENCFRKGDVNLLGTCFMLSNGNKKYFPVDLKEL